MCASARGWWMCAGAYVCVRVWTHILGDCQPTTLPRVLTCALCLERSMVPNKSMPFLSDVGAPGPGGAPSCPEGVGQLQHKYCQAQHTVHDTPGSPVWLVQHLRYDQVYLERLVQYGSVQGPKDCRGLQPSIQRRQGWVSSC